MGETPSSTSSFLLDLDIHLDHALIGTTMGMSGELVSMSKYCLRAVLMKDRPIFQPQQVA
jgi:hypothetical protein